MRCLIKKFFRSHYFTRYLVVILLISQIIFLLIDNRNFVKYSIEIICALIGLFGTCLIIYNNLYLLRRSYKNDKSKEEYKNHQKNKQNQRRYLNNIFHAFNNIYNEILWIELIDGRLDKPFVMIELNISSIKDYRKHNIKYFKRFNYKLKTNNIYYLKLIRNYYNMFVPNLRNKLLNVKTQSDDLLDYMKVYINDINVIKDTKSMCHIVWNMYHDCIDFNVSFSVIKDRLDNIFGRSSHSNPTKDDVLTEIDIVHKSLMYAENKGQKIRQNINSIKHYLLKNSKKFIK